VTLRALEPRDLLSTFELPDELIATGPPEARSLARDEVKLLVAAGGRLSDHTFADLAHILEPGDLLVVNNSQTLPAAVVVDERRIVHFSTSLPGGLRVVEMRYRDRGGTKPALDLEPGVVGLPGGARLELLAPYPVDTATRRLWVAHVESRIPLEDYLRSNGRAISYSNSNETWPLEAYQTVFARIPGSAEMPSAARPFSARLVTSLVAKGVGVAPITLHTGVSSLEIGEDPYAEWFEVPAATSELIMATRVRGDRVVAVGTTVVRALASVTDDTGGVRPGAGWTDLVVGPDSRLPMIDGLITGWHEPRSSHLDILRAFTRPDMLDECYSHALAKGYLWHEFGDSHLILR